MGRALVISSVIPDRYASVERRVLFAFCTMMAELGYKQTLLHIPFYGKWQWRTQPVDSQELKKIGITQEIEIYPDNPTIGKKCNDDNLYLLDDWCAPNIESFLINHLRRNFYDAVIVQNVWLSKYLGIFQNATTKIVLSQDHLSNRCTLPKIIKGGNTPYISNDNYVCSEKDEIFGLERAHLVLSSNSEYATWIRSKTKRTEVIDFPISIWSSVTDKPTTYRHPEKVIFGLIDEGRITSRYHLTQFLSALKTKLLTTPTSIEIVIYGQGYPAINKETFPFVKLFAQDLVVAAFYDAIDFILVPHDVYGELSLTVSDAIGHEIPVLATDSGSAGLKLHEELVHKSQSELADVIIDITILRPKYETFTGYMAKSKLSTLDFQSRSKKLLSDNLATTSCRFVVYYAELNLTPNHPLFAATIATLRLLCGQGRVSVIANSGELINFSKVVSQLPASAEVIATEFHQLDGDHSTFIDDTNEELSRLMSGSVFITTNEKIRSRTAKAEYFDRRISTGNSRVRALRNQRDGTDLSLPLFSEDLRWDPNIVKPHVPHLDACSLLIRLTHERARVFEQYLKIFYPTVVLITFSEESDLIRNIPFLFTEQKINKIIFMNAPVSATEFCLLEYLKFFGFVVFNYNGIESLKIDDRLFEPLINSHNIELSLTKRAVSVLRG
jgi:hypothetical protein